MFGFSGQVEEDDDTSDDNSSCPTHKHFNATEKPRSKLGRRRLVPQKGEKAQDSDACHNGEQRLQSQWLQREDSGFSTSGSTPSLTHPVARTGVLFNNQSKPNGNNFMSSFTPSLKSGRENKFALLVTPMRSLKSDPLKEINGVNNIINKSSISNESSTLTSETIKEGSGNSVQNQLNCSFISDESLPLKISNDSHPHLLAANKTSNETANSDDSSFMTAHDIHRPEVQTNKTFYDPEFLKTPGKNLAEIRIDDSPFNPLEGFLEESDDFQDYQPRTPFSNSNCLGNPAQASITKTNRPAPVETTKACVELLYSGPRSSDHSQNDQMAFPLAKTGVTPIAECQTRSGTNINPLVSQDYHNKNNFSQSKDNGFKDPGFVLGPTQKCTNKVELNLNSSDVGNMRSLEGKDCGEIVHGSCSAEETKNVTYPQHSRGHQKNSFTSQFSLDPSSRMKPGFQDSGKALSLSSALSRPLSAASCATNHGVISSSMGASTNPFDKPPNVGAAPVVGRVGTLMNHPANYDGNRMGGVVEGRGSCGDDGMDRYLSNHVAYSVAREPKVCPSNSGSATPGLTTDHLDSTITWISCVKPVKSQSNHKIPEPGGFEDQSFGSRSQQEEDSLKSTSVSVGLDGNTVVLAVPTVVSKGQSLPPQLSSEPPAPIAPPVNSASVVSQQPNPVQVPLESHQQEEGSLKSTSVDGDTVVLADPTVVSRGRSRPPQLPSEPPVPIAPPVNSTSVASQQSNPVQVPLASHRSGNSVMSALIKPQPQNVITIKETSYTVLSLLGRGGSSQVYQALGPKSSKLMAIKCVNLAIVEEAMATDYLNEIALLSKLQGCPSVIKMIEHEYVEQSQMLYVVLEKGDIDFSKLIKNISETKQISMAMITYYWTEMLSAVHEIHKRGIIHSDLKPANFLLVEGRLKLIDFGIASSLQGEDTTSVMKEVPAGTYNYMSPEAISGRKINRKSDVWSMGCILFNLLYGRTPFSHLNNRWQKLHAIADPNHKVTFPKLQHHTPPSLRLALRWCLIKEPASRPTVEELVKLSELAPHADSSLGKEIDGMMCKYFRKVLPNLKVLSEEEDMV